MPAGRARLRQRFWVGRDDDSGNAVSAGHEVPIQLEAQGGQFGTFDYDDPVHRDACKRAVELTAHHFDKIILDDFFCYTTNSMSGGRSSHSH